ncbi:MAG: sodium:solute symporter [Bacteroidales bacterium]|nr:sodium:solute symporter [Bacteroidales bacterium]
MGITVLDYIVFFVFVGGVALFGCSFYFRSRKGAGSFTAANGSLPAWVVGMSIFATFVSSISFLGLPGDAFKGNWNPFVFSLSIPIATWLAAKVFIPLYRGTNSVSAYHYLETRFGYWARCYVAVCYLLTQLARVGSILLLLALPLNTMFGWDIRTVIICTGVITLVYTLLGGIAAVVWTDAVQGIILIVGAVACALILTFSMPDGPSQLFSIAAEHGKMSLGSFGASLSQPTFWVVLVYGLFVNMQNYGIDQNYVQRYMTTKSTAEAVKSTLFGGLLYIPVSFVFVYIGTALFSYYTASPELLPAGTAADQVFPHFIVYGLPTGLTGLVIASLFSAGMSTVASSINSSATIVLTDFVRHRFPKLSDRRAMPVLYATSFVVGALGIVMGLLMMNVDGILDAWWKLASIFSGGMLGLFLLGLVLRRVNRPAAVTAVVAGLLVIAWMSLSPLINDGSPFYRFRNPMHTYLTIVVGTTVIFLVGFLLTKLASALRRRRPEEDTLQTH